MRILVLGGYGLIGTHIVQHLCNAGHNVVGLGRSIAQPERIMPQASWISADLASMMAADDWRDLLSRITPEAIVNCAGVLQDGIHDDVVAVQAAAMRALYSAAPACGVKRLVQISAPRARVGAETAFMSSKGDADAALAGSALEWVVLRPGLVLSPQAYGGTALLRALAAVPWLQPIAYGSSLVQTVAADDVAGAVLTAVEGRIPLRQTYDLVEDEPHELRDVLPMMRHWLGLAPAPRIEIPRWLIGALSIVADLLGWLGWRSPLRSTAMTEIAAGVCGDAGPWRTATGSSLSSMATTLQRLPSTVQERWFARSFLIKPVAIGVLACFWMATGLIALVNPRVAMAVLTERGLAAPTASAVAAGGGVIDVVLGLALLWKPWMPGAARGMIVVTLGYIAGGSVLAPDLWLDPLGPLLKAIPTLVVASIVLALAEDR